MDKLLVSMSGIVDMAKNGISSGVDILMKQAPDIVHQFLMYKMVIAGMTAALAIVGVIALATILVKTLKKISAISTEYDDMKIVLKYIIPIATWFFTGITVFAWLGSTFYVNAVQFIYIWVAPKVYLIEFFSGLIKK